MLCKKMNEDILKTYQLILDEKDKLLEEKSRIIERLKYELLLILDKPKDNSD